MRMAFGEKSNKENYLDFVPAIVEGTRHSEKEDGTVAVFIEWKGFFPRLAQKLFKKPRFTETKLDNYGSAVWKLIDGKRNVGEISEALKSEFPDMEYPLERTIKFLEILKEHHLIQLGGI